MNQPKLHKILVTRELSDGQIARANAVGLDPVVEPALEFEFPDHFGFAEEILQNNRAAAWVFTSQNGVEALKKMLGSSAINPENLSVYAVGDKTAEALSDLGFEAIVPEIQDGEHLAEVIIRNSAKPVIHWCGDKRRDELRSALEKEEIELIEMVVYKTKLRKMNLPSVKTEAILFFSPNSVEAFRNSGGFEGEVPELFAVGQTTGEFLALESGKNVHIPAVPSAEALLELAGEILKTNEINSYK
jgi:uroporphyrinogen-III synthase